MECVVNKMYNNYVVVFDSFLSQLKSTVAFGHKWRCCVCRLGGGYLDSVTALEWLLKYAMSRRN